MLNIYQVTVPQRDNRKVCDTSANYAVPVLLQNNACKLQLQLCIGYISTYMQI